MNARFGSNTQKQVEMNSPHFITLSVLGGATYNVSLTNVSLNGLQINLPPQVGPAEIPGSSKVELSGFPDDMDDLNHTLGTVIWITDGCCGVRFDSNLEGLHLGGAAG